MAFNLRSFFSLRKSSIEDVSAPRRGFGYSAGVRVTDDSAMQVSAFYRGVMYISSQIGKLPWETKSATDEVIEDDLSMLLSLQPNPEMNALDFRMLAIQTAIIQGNFFAEIERNTTGRPIAMWPLDAKRVYLDRDDNDRLMYMVRGGSRDGSTTAVDPRNMFHLKNFHKTSDGLLGQGVVAYAIHTLGIAAGSDRMAGNIFANGGIPSGVLKHKGRLSDEAYKRLKDSWREDNSGANSGGVALLEEGTEFEPLNQDPQVLQFLESRKFSVLEIARFLNISPIKLYDITAATYSNVENANLDVANDPLDAWCCSLEIEADIKILNKRYGGRYTELDLYSILRGDMKTRSDYFSKLMQNGAITPNEIRKAEGLPRYEGGDSFYIAVNNYTPADRVNDIIDSQISKNKQPAAAPQPSAPPAKDPARAELELAAIEFLRK